MNNHTRNGDPANRRLSARKWPVRWHRIRTIREREEISVNALARRTKIPAGTLRRLEREDSDLTLSTLHRLAEGLGVPVAELLHEPNEGLSEPIRQRACLVRVARTAHTLLEQSTSEATRNLAQTLLNQLMEIMPELADVGKWPEFGSRRPATDVPRLLERMLCRAPTPYSDSAVDWWDDVTTP